MPMSASRLTHRPCVSLRMVHRYSYVIVGAVSAATALVYAVLHEPTFNPDSMSFLQASLPFDETRTPGYPAVLALLGREPWAIYVAQIVAAAGTAVGVAYLAEQAVRRWWAGTAVGCLFAISCHALGWARVVSSEALSVPLIVAVACAIVADRRRLAFVLAAWLMFTRPEFVLLPVLLLAAWRTRQAAIATAGIYVLLGIYVLGNWQANDYPGVSVISRVNLFGKVMQYRMHDEAPGGLSRDIEQFLARPTDGDPPYVFAELHPDVKADNWQAASDFSTAAIRSNPAEYGWRTARQFLNDWTIVLVCGFWVGAWWRSRMRTLGVLSSLILYDLVMVSLGGYKYLDRLQAPARALWFVVLCSTLIVGAKVIGRASIGIVRARRIDGVPGPVADRG